MKDKKLFKGIVVFYVIVGIVWIVSIATIGYLILHPEIIGNWFSRLISGLK